MKAKKLKPQGKFPMEKSPAACGQFIELKSSFLTVVADGFDGAFAEYAFAFFALRVRLRLLVDV